MESPRGIEPRSLTNENLTIRPWRFTPTEAVFLALSYVNFLVLVLILVVVEQVKNQNDMLKFCFGYFTFKKSINKRHEFGGGWGGGA